jgi:cyclopropane-fatty-acyl-phospholipid synthase
MIDYQGFVRQRLGQAGIGVGASGSSDIQVHRSRFYRRLVRGRQLGMAESYMDGDWDSAHLDQVATRLLLSTAGNGLHSTPRELLERTTAKLLPRWTRPNVMRRVAPHYNLGNDLFEKMLDRDYMAYTCGYWRGGATTLEEAQRAKLDLICRKLGLQEGMTVLDIGCGWGPFAKYAAETYGATVTGVTLSERQVELGRRRCEGLPVELMVRDYRDVEGTFDRVVSVGCLEHIGHRNHRTFFETIYRSLKDGGRALVHSFGVAKSQYIVGGFYEKYVFPLVNLPSVAQIGKALDGLFVVEDVHNFGPDYDPTLMEWNKRFQAAWPELEGEYGKMLGGRFKRMFEFYLLCTAGFMRSRTGQIWQWVLTKPGTPQPVCRLS